MRDELPPRPTQPLQPPLPVHQALARKIKVGRILRQWSRATLAEAAGLPLFTIVEIESGEGLVELGELEALAQALGTTLTGLFAPPGRTPKERAVLALLKERG